MSGAGGVISLPVFLAVPPTGYCDEGKSLLLRKTPFLFVSN